MEAAKSQRRREEEASTELPSLPIELITEILLRSPVKSVGRFRCLSKDFCSELTDPKFAKNHLDLIPVQSRNLRLILVFFNKLSAFDINDSNDVKQLDYPFKKDIDLLSETKTETYKKGFSPWRWQQQRRRVVFVGSSNGLVCISSVKDTVFFYNPTIGDFKRIPDLPKSMRFKFKNSSKHVRFDIHGFGFDAFNEDYKLVKFVLSDKTSNIKLKANVYSLKTDSWRGIRNLRYWHVNPNSGVYVNGAIHWIVKLKEEDQHDKRVIAAFDLKTEEFRDISLPDEAGDCNHSFMKLEVGSLKECLCVNYNCAEQHGEIWVMNEYGVQSSWCKIRIGRFYTSMKPIGSTKNDKEGLIMIDGKLILYNFESDTWRTKKVRNVKLHDGFEGNTYVESLISPNSYDTTES